MAITLLHVRALVVVPTYNEVANIAELLQEVRSVCPDLDVLVVDDDSPDGTAQRAAELAESLGGITVLPHGRKAGLGRAYVDGFLWALSHGYGAVAQMDADLSHDPRALPSLFAELERGADFVVGSRYVPGGSVHDWSRRRRALSRWANRYARWMLRLRTADVTAGYRAFRRQALEKLDLAAVQSDGYGFQIEVLHRLERASIVGREVPIAFRDRTRGRSKMSARIIAESFVFVTCRGVADRLRLLVRRSHPSRLDSRPV